MRLEPNEILIIGLIMVGFMTFVWPNVISPQKIMVIDRESMNFTELNASLSGLQANNSILQNQTVQLKTNLEQCRKNTSDYWANANWILYAIGLVVGFSSKSVTEWWFELQAKKNARLNIEAEERIRAKIAEEDEKKKAEERERRKQRRSKV